MWGFLPNYAVPFSHRPEVAQAWQALNLAIRGGMDRRRYEIATIAASRARRSTYCTAAHSKFLRDVCDDEAAMLSINDHPDGAGLDETGPRDLRVRRRLWPRTRPASNRLTSTACWPSGCRTQTSPTSSSLLRPGASSPQCSTVQAPSSTPRRPLHSRPTRSMAWSSVAPSQAPDSQPGASVERSPRDHVGFFPRASRLLSHRCAARTAHSTRRGGATAHSTRRGRRQLHTRREASSAAYGLVVGKGVDAAG